MASEHDAKTIGAALLVTAIAETIQSLGEVPSGVLYAQVSHVIGFETYNLVLDLLIKSRWVKRDRSHLLHWIGPAPVSTKES